MDTTNTFEWIHDSDIGEDFTVVPTLKQDLLFRLASTNNSLTPQPASQVELSPSLFEINLYSSNHDSSNLTPDSLRNLALMIERSAADGRAFLVGSLLDFGNEHDVPYERLITPTAVSAAIQGAHLAVLKEMYYVMPEFVSMDLGNGVTPLRDVIYRGIDELPVHLQDDVITRYNKRYVPIVEFFLQSGANPNHCRWNEASYLNTAAGKSCLEIVELLLKYGAKIEGSRAVHAAALNGRVDVLEVLIRRGADVDERAIYAFRRLLETPLHVAVKAQQEEVVRWLLDHGASTEIKDVEGKTALDLLDEDALRVRKMGVVLRETEVQGVCEEGSAGKCGEHDLTDGEWLAAVDAEDIPGAVATRIEARKKRREQNRLRKLEMTQNYMRSFDSQTE